MEKRLIATIVCVFVFFALFIATLPMTVHENMPSKPGQDSIVQEVTPEERIERHNNRLRSQTDNTLYRAAVSNDDRSRCANIHNHELRQDCVEQTSEPRDEPEPEVVEQDEPRRQVSSSDTTNFRIAVSNQDSNRCQQIQNEDYKQECLELIQ